MNHAMRTSTIKSEALFFVLVFLSAEWFIVAPATATTTKEWFLELQQDGIDVYTRPVEGSGIKEFKGVAIVDASIDGILSLLRDSSGFKTWFPNTAESKFLGREGDYSYQYSVMALPWPMSNRDNILRSSSTRSEETGVVDITIVAAPDYYPIQDGLIRVQKAHGIWRLEPLGEHKTHVMFTMHLELGGGIPQWMINARVVAAPFEALTNLRAKVAGQ